jgi:peptide/nickel transport system permease protein
MKVLGKAQGPLFVWEKVRAAALPDATLPSPDSSGLARRERWRFIRHPALVLGLALLGLIAILAILAPILTPFDPFASAGTALRPPSAGHWFGTDDLGRDIFSRVIYGGRISLMVGVVVALTSALIATVVGGVAGSSGRWIDDSLMRVTELTQVVPRFFLAILVAALFGNRAWLTALVLGLTFWPSTARLLRGQVLSLREREFVLAARTLGAPERRILWRHIMPHAVPVVLISASLQVGSAMLVEAGLSFLGLSDPSVVSWGAMLQGAQLFVRSAWWMSVFPGMAILLTVLAANLIADGLQDATSPRR